ADGGNLARAFGASAQPGAARARDGAPDGGGAAPTAAIAAAIERELIDGADLVIDLHSAGRAGAMPLFCGFLAGGDPAVAAGAEAAARAFAAPLTWAHDEIGPGRTLSAARDRGIPAIYVEAGGGGEVRGAELDALVGGVLAVLADLGLTLPAPDMTAGLGPQEGPDPALLPASRRIVRGGDGDLDRSPAAPAAGTLVTRTRAGAAVRAGDPLAELFGDDDHDAPPTAIAAPCDGIVMYVRRDARVAAGDAIALIAPEPVAW
ncbi:succinylglutamate desuccinylase/aspartoacylase family protein, partial [Conexibacter stalactiti]